MFTLNNSSNNSETTATKPILKFKHNEQKISKALSLTETDIENIADAANFAIGKPLNNANSTSEMIEVFLTFLNDNDYNNEFKAISISVLFTNMLEELKMIAYE